MVRIQISLMYKLQRKVMDAFSSSSRFVLVMLLEDNSLYDVKKTLLYSFF
jgi:hypothetical protein